MNKLGLLILITASACLTACGDDGNDSEGTAPSSSNSSQILINDSNAYKVASMGYDSASLPLNAAAFSSTNPYSGSSTRSIGKESDSCDYSGTGTYSYRFNTDYAPFSHKGDSMSVSFINCSDYPQEYINGSFTLEAVDIGSSSNSIKMIMNLDLSGIENYSLKGDMTVTTSENSLALSCDNLAGTADAQTTILRNTTIQFTDEYGGSSTLAMSGDIVSTELGGSFTVSTNPDLRSGPDDSYPTFGVIKFTGMNQSYVELNTDTGQVDTVQMTFFDGSTTSSNTISWASLNN